MAGSLGRILLIVLLMFFLLSSINVAKPEEEPSFTTIELFRDCRGVLKPIDALEPAEYVGVAACAMYFGGLLDMHSVMSTERLGNGRPLFCTPSTGISNEQAARIFLKWAENHPESLHESARVEAILALSHAFPCDG